MRRQWIKAVFLVRFEALVPETMERQRIKERVVTTKNLSIALRVSVSYGEGCKN